MVVPSHIHTPEQLSASVVAHLPAVLSLAYLPRSPGFGATTSAAVAEKVPAVTPTHVYTVANRPRYNCPGDVITGTPVSTAG